MSQSDPAQLLELARLALVGRLARGVVHELNNPLFVVLALAELMQRSAEPGSQAADRLAQIHESGSEMRRLVSAVGEVARTPAGGNGDVATLVAPALEQAADIVRRVTLRKEIGVTVRADDGGAAVAAARGELLVVLLGLLAEAQETTPEDGHIEAVSLRHGDRVQVAVRWPAAPEARVGVLDGVLQELLAAHGGALRVGASAAGGSEVVLSLPAVAP